MAAETPSFAARVAHRLSSFGPSIWTVFSPMSKKFGSMNLGQGFSDMEAPSFVCQAMSRAVHEGHNAYAPPVGHPPLMEAIARKYSPEFHRDIEASSEVHVGVGATGIIGAIMQAFVQEGDEVVVFEPSFDIYGPQTIMAGGSLVRVPLLPPTTHDGDWSFSIDELAASVTPRTKILLVNTPHNPTGHMFSRTELEAIADVVRRNPQVMVVADEVYERFTFGAEHVHIATLPGMWERTLTVSSAGKTFNCTGWKVGWAIGPEELVAPVMLATQWVIFSAPTPTQKAVADILAEAEEPFRDHASYYDFLRSDYARRRDKLLGFLADAGIPGFCPKGGFFVLADTSGLSLPADSPHVLPGESRDWGLCRWLTAEVGVTAIPPSVFYTDATAHLGHNLMRFAFCKDDATLDEAGKRLRALQQRS